MNFLVNLVNCLTMLSDSLHISWHSSTTTVTGVVLSFLSATSFNLYAFGFPINNFTLLVLCVCLLKW